MGSIAIEEFVEKSQTCDGMNHLQHGESNGTSTTPAQVGPEAHDALPPIAIVGMAMRLPGGITSAEEFWDFLVAKGDARGRVPETRFNIDSFYNSSKPGSVKTQYGYFLHEDPAYVDAPFFSMARFEASNIDPQQRLLLEVVWECLENGGQTGWRGKDIGCFVGSFGEEWLDMSSKDTQDIGMIRALGTGDFALSNRISYEYDLKGPSVTIRTACSSSMLALHEACRSLYSKECSSAIVAGTNLILGPTMSATMSDNRVLSPSGICKSFDAEADGYGRGEAINAIYVKTLEDAVRDGDPIRAIIRSTATNCDGRTPNITTPGAETQEQLIRQAYSQANIQDISKTAFFECHGTGTVIGDTTELSAVAKLFEGRGVYIGAVKPNVGHSEGASGITGIIKAALALENKIIPPNIHFNSPNPKGALGTDYLATRSEREHLKHRAFAVLKEEGSIDFANFETSQSTKSQKMVFVFTGQGAQWPGMGKQLLSEFDNFRDDIRAMDRALQTLVHPPNWRIEEELLKASHPTRVDEPEFAQTLCSAVQLGIANLLSRWGILPAGVVGHSSGEIAAAYSAGAITMESAIIISYHRGQLANSTLRDKTKPQGGMAAVGISPKEAKRYLVDGVVVACENSYRSVTLSGDGNKLDAILDQIKSTDEDTFCRRLRVGIAYHSSHMQELAEPYHDLIRPHITFNDTMVPLYSSVTGRTVERPPQLNSEYWVKNLVSPVLFSTAVETYFKENEGSATLLEIGPHSALSGPLRQIFESHTAKHDAVYIPTLIRGDDQVTSLMTAAGRAYIKGTSVRFSAINGPGKVVASLPTYPWQHDQKYWEESRLSQRWRHRGFPHHEILGSRVLESSDLEPTWRNLLRVEHVPWIWEHRLNKEIIFPCAGYVAMAGEAIYQATGAHGYSIRNLFMKTALVLQDTSVLELITSLRPVRLTDSADSKWHDFTISSCSDNIWKRHCTGQVRSGDAEECHFTEHPRPFVRKIHSDSWYDALSRRGLDYGPRFRGLEGITADPVTHQASATIIDDEELHDSNYSLHPTAIDQCLQLFSVAFTHGISRQLTKLSMPLSIEKINISKGGPSMCVQAKGIRSSSNTASGNVSMVSGDKAVLSMEGAQFFTIDDENANDSNSGLVSRCEWKPDIDFFPISELLPAVEPEIHARKLIGKFSHLSIIECSSRIGSLTTESPYLNKYMAWITSQAEHMNDGLNEFVPEGPQWAAATSEARLAIMVSLRQELEVEAPNFLPLIDTTRRLLDNISKIIEGEVSALEILMENDGLKEIYDSMSMSSGWPKFLSLLGHSNPALRVLEIGAGVGSATARVLRDLTLAGGTRMYSQYTFTDISPGMLPSAKERFKDFEEIEYSILDITRDPVEQGFSEGSYDLIIASNVLHATPALSATLRNVRALLAPGGRLLLEELCPVTLPFFDLVMGILPGWWLGEDDGRRDRPYVTPERWDQELLKTGFKGVEAMRLDSEEPYQLNATMISRYADEGSVKGQVYLLHRAEVHTWARILEAELIHKGYTVNWCTLQQVPANQVIISLLDLEGPFFDNISEEDFCEFQCCMLAAGSSRILWVTKETQIKCADPRYGLVLGLARTVRSELNTDFSTFEVDQFDTIAANSLCGVLEKIHTLRKKNLADPEYEFALQNGTVQVGRFYWTPLGEEAISKHTPTTSRTLDIGTYGLLDSICWVEEEEPILAEDEIGVDMKYIGLNFKDIMVSMGVIGDKSEFGIESTGVVSKLGSKVKDLDLGQRVLIVGSGVIRTHKVISAKRCLPIPDGLSSEDATTMAAVYATVIFSLIKIGNVQKDQSVLIHSACGGVGLAAIQLCQSIGTEIFVTVGNEQKRKHLIENYQIPEDHIFDSRSTSFLADVMRQTNGRGVDLVLNSLSGELLHASWKCVAELGKMIELGKRDILGHALLSMDGFSCNRSYCGVDLFRLSETNEEGIRKLLYEVLKLFQQGKILPIRPMTIFEATDIVQAFKHMQTGKHMGKILIKMPDDPTQLPLTKSRQTLRLSPDGSYLLVGGLGGLGRAITTWMIECGARHFIFLSRSAGESDTEKSFLRELAVQNCTASLVLGNVANLDDVKRAVTVCSRPILGVINMAMVLRDQAFEKMTYDNWNTVLAPKVEGTWNLHNVLKDVPLDFFILFSSITSLGGNAGQANYTAANAFLDTFVQYRQSLNLPAWTINIGLMRDIGYASQNLNLVSPGFAGVVEMLEEANLLDALHGAIAKSKGSGSGQLAIGLGTSKGQPLWVSDARFTVYNNLQSRDKKADFITGDDLRNLIEDIKRDPGVLDAQETEEKIAEELRMLIGSRMGHDEDADKAEIDNMAIDSLMTIEIRSWFRRNLALEVSLVEISNAQTVGGLTKTTLNALRSKYQTQTLEHSGDDCDSSSDSTTRNRIWDADTVLGSKMRPIPGTAVDWQHDTEGRVFMSGATGFVGAFLLAALLDQPYVKAVACLVRASDEHTGRVRIREAFEKYGIKQKFGEKLLVVPGDLSRPTLGLGQKRFDDLSEWASVVFHLGAHVNYLEPYSAHRETNVLGTYNMLQFANNKRPITFHYSSSIAAYGLGAYTGERCIPEDEKPAVDHYNPEPQLGYTQSKAVAETVLWNAMSNGIPITIYHLGVVLGHSVSGIGNSHDAVHRMMSSCIQVGSYPIIPKQRNQFIPVDYVVSCLLKISASNENLGHAYNVVQPNQEAVVDLPATFDMLSRCCPFPLRPIPYESWIESVSKTKSAGMGVFLPTMEERDHDRAAFWWDVQTSTFTYGTDNLRRALLNSPEVLQVPPMDDLIKSWSTQWLKGASVMNTFNPTCIKQMQVSWTNEGGEPVYEDDQERDFGIPPEYI
ncbi:Type I Iterative PKS [Arthroderma sp. PD_2]|nr:Type I Iterative PKS [Arthroderma sp. PD_2]